GRPRAGGLRGSAAPVHVPADRRAARPHRRPATAVGPDSRPATTVHGGHHWVPVPAPVPAGARGLRDPARADRTGGRPGRLPRPARRVEAVMLTAHALTKQYPVRGGEGTVHALAGVSLELAEGETLGIVGESGCGKSTLAKILVCLEDPTSGTVELDGVHINALRGRALREQRRRIQTIFHDPASSLSPRVRVGRAIGEVLAVHGIAVGARQTSRRVAEVLELVGLAPQLADRFPHELSGGQRQRVGIARALAVEPRVLLLDEPVSALDVSVRAEIMNLLATLRAELRLSYVFISHDVAMVRHISDRGAVMYLWP